MIHTVLYKVLPFIDSALEIGFIFCLDFLIDKRNFVPWILELYIIFFCFGRGLYYLNQANFYNY